MYSHMLLLNRCIYLIRVDCSSVSCKGNLFFVDRQNYLARRRRRNLLAMAIRSRLANQINDLVLLLPTALLAISSRISKSMPNLFMLPIIVVAIVANWRCGSRFGGDHSDEQPD